MLNNWYKWWITPLPGLTITPKHILDAPDEKEHVYISHLPHSNLGEDLEGSPIFWEKTGQSMYELLYDACLLSLLVGFCLCDHSYCVWC